MNESEYRNAIFLLQASTDALKQLHSQNASPEEITEAHGSLAKAKARIDELLKTATPQEREQMSIELGNSLEAGY